ncbi:MAG TPA: tetratricopeptide repeat protein, partial [Allocoleopsis sp.]
MTQPMQSNPGCPQWQRALGGVGLTVGVTVGMTLAILGTDMPRVLAQTPGVVSEGYALLERGWVNDAIATFREAVQQYPQSVPAQLGLAIAYQRAGQDANAWTAYQRVLGQDPNNKTALAAVGTLGGYRPEWQQQGILALTTLLNLEPQNLDARAQRALLYGYQGQYAESIADYEIALASNPKPAVVLGAAQIYAYSGDYPESLARFEQYLRTGATLPNAAITAYALALQETGSADRAVQILSDRLQTLPPTTPLDDTAIQMRAALAVAYQKNNQLDAALAVLEPLRGNPDAALPLARALSAIGRAEGNTDLYGEAVNLYRQVLQRTQSPSVALKTEVADVLSEYALSQPQALLLYQELLATQP